MRPMEVQYITREMIARLKKPASLLWDSIEDGSGSDGRRGGSFQVSCCWFYVWRCCCG